MEWSNDLVFKLIDEYKKRPLLWDTSDNCYKIHSKKNDAWCEIAAIMGTDISEVKKKINSLLASYRRERQKITAKHELYMETYPSTWFAFQRFDFLTDIYTPRKRLNPLFHCEDPAEQQNIEGVMEMKLEVLDEDGDNRASPDFKHVRIKKGTPSESEYPARKRKPTTDDDVLETRSFEVHPRDEFTVYGEHVANELRKLPLQVQNKVKHLISNVIYEAQMGVYEIPESFTRRYAQSTHTPLSYSTHFEDSFSNENAQLMVNNSTIVKQEELSD